MNDAFLSFLPLILIFVIFYFLLIRPQQKRMKAHKEMLSKIKRGDQIKVNWKTLGFLARDIYYTPHDALEVLTKGLAKELRGFRVNCVAPSAIDTNFQKRLSTKKRLRKIIQSTPLGRIGFSEDISNLVTFLCSDAATYINGETIYITGGR